MLRYPERRGGRFIARLLTFFFFFSEAFFFRNTALHIMLSR